MDVELLMDGWRRRRRGKVGEWVSENEGGRGGNTVIVEGGGGGARGCRGGLEGIRG